MTDETNSMSSIELAAELTVAWLSNPNVRATADDVPAFLRQMHGTLSELSSPSTAAGDQAQLEQSYTPAVSPRTSVKPDHIVSLIDGKKYKTLRRHLSTHGLTPDDYRRRYGLKADYPMVAPNYSALRREAAQKIGLGGRKKKSDDASAAGDAAAKPARAARKPRAAKAENA
jgi:predicted transcriptional regulator